MTAAAGADGGAAMCRAPSADAVRGTPLHWACAAGQLDVALALIELGADVNAVDYMGTLFSRRPHRTSRRFCSRLDLEQALAMH